MGAGRRRARRVAACATGRSEPASVPALAAAGRCRPLRVGRLRRRRRLVAGRRRGVEVAPDRVRRASGRQRGRARAAAQADRTADPLVGRALVGRLRTRGDARRAGAGRQRGARSLARDLGGDRRLDDRRGPVLPPADQGVPARRRVVHRRRRQSRSATGADRRGRAADRLRPHRRRVDLRRRGGGHLCAPGRRLSRRPAGIGRDRGPARRQPSRRRRMRS